MRTPGKQHSVLFSVSMGRQAPEWWLGEAETKGVVSVYPHVLQAFSHSPVLPTKKRTPAAETDILNWVENLFSFLSLHYCHINVNTVNVNNL